MESLARDIRHALRSLLRTPVFALVAIGSLTLAVSANTAVFSLLNSLAWRELPVRDPGTLVQLSTVSRAGQEAGMSWAIFQALRRSERVFSATMGWVASSVLTVEAGAGLERLAVAGASAELYAELGVVPDAGRWIAPEDIDLDRGTAEAAAIVSRGFADRRFGGAASALGKVLRIEGVPFTVVGVAPRGFTGLTVIVEPDVTVPLTFVPELFAAPADWRASATRWFQVTGRLRPDTSIEAADAQLQAAWLSVLETAVPAAFSGAEREEFLSQRLVLASAARGVERSLRREFTRPLQVVLAIAGLVLLITAVNLWSLAQARAEARVFEMRVRQALGAGRARIVRSAVAEGVLLGVTSAVLSVPIAYQVSTAVSRLVFDDWLVSAGLTLIPDARVIAVAALGALGAGVMMAGIPAWMLSGGRQAPLAALGSRTVAQSGRAGQWLVTAQIALSIVLLVASALLVRSLWHIASTDDGLRAGVMVAYPQPRMGAYRGVDPESYYREALSRVRAVPGVEAAAFTQFKPAGGALLPEPVARASDARGGSGDAQASATQVSPGFFDTLGIRLLEGRDFSWNDTSRSPRVAILSRSLARRLFDNGIGIGERVRIGTRPDTQAVTVVGIVEDAHLYDVRSPNLLIAYTPSLQRGPAANWKALVLRGSGLSARSLQSAVDALGVDIIDHLVSLDYIVSRTILRERLMAMLAAYFGALALILASIGVYGQMSYMLSARRKEIGIRVALGAGAARIIRWIISKGLLIGAIGASIGLAATLPAIGFLRSLLVGTSPYDPAAIAGAPLLLLGAILAATLLPAWRASSVDPMVELRRE